MQSITRALPPSARRRAAQSLTVLGLATLLAGCGLFGGASTAPTAVPTRTPFPTFTATPATAPQPTATPAPAQPEPAAPAAAAPAAPVTEPSPTATPAQPTPAPARLTITSDLVNVRGGPGTDFGLVGTAATGESFAVTGRNEAGDWWQICCVNGQPGWVFGELATVENAAAVALASDLPAAAPQEPPAQAPAEAPAETPAEAPAEAPTAAPAEAPTEAPAPAAPYDPTTSSAGNFDPNAQYQIVHFKVLGLDENNGGIRDSSSQHLIFLTVLDQAGNGVDGAVVRNLVGDKSEVVTGAKGPGKVEISMFWEPFKLAVVSDPSGPVTSQVSNQMGLAFPHLPDIVGKLGDVNYEYGACPTLEIRCQWPIQAIHFSYEITFQRVK
jgi:hypothetical protein